MNRCLLAIALGLVLALALALAACTGEPEPKFAPSQSASPASRESPAATGDAEPAMPATAQENNAAGAEAFVRYFIEVLNYAQKTGNTARLQRVSTPRCAACEGYAEESDKTYAAGGHVKGGVLTIGDLRELPRDYGRGRATPQTIFHGNGTKASFDGGPFELYAYARWVDDRWAMQWMRTPT